MRDCGQTAPLREVKLQTDLCGPWRNPPRRLAGGCSSAFAQLSHFPRYPAGWRAVAPRLPSGSVTEKRSLRDLERLRFCVSPSRQSALLRRMRFSSPAQTSSHLTEKRSLQPSPHGKAQFETHDLRKDTLWAIASHQKALLATQPPDPWHLADGPTAVLVSLCNEAPVEFLTQDHLIARRVHDHHPQRLRIAAVTL